MSTIKHAFWHCDTCNMQADPLACHYQALAAASGSNNGWQGAGRGHQQYRNKWHVILCQTIWKEERWKNETASCCDWAQSNNAGRPSFFCSSYPHKYSVSLPNQRKWCKAKKGTTTVCVGRRLASFPGYISTTPHNTPTGSECGEK